MDQSHANITLLMTESKHTPQYCQQLQQQALAKIVALASPATTTLDN